MNLIRVNLGADNMSDGTPLKNISEYSSADVLCGRGGGTNHHTGNNHWRALVAANKRLYISLPKKQKVLVAKSIVHAIRSQTQPHGGRFLQKDSSHLWNDIGDQKATEKTSQALREGAPDIRTEMEQEQKTTAAAAANEPAVMDLMALSAGGLCKPGQILPNGLITLDYEGVQLATQRGGGGPVQDGTIDVTHSLPAFPMGPQLPMPMGPQQQQQQQGGAPINPMMAAFQQFMGQGATQMGFGTGQGQQPGQPCQAPGTNPPQGQQPQAPMQPQQQQSAVTVRANSSGDAVSEFQQFLNIPPGQNQNNDISSTELDSPPKHQVQLKLDNAPAPSNGSTVDRPKLLLSKRNSDRPEISAPAPAPAMILPTQLTREESLSLLKQTKLANQLSISSTANNTQTLVDLRGQQQDSQSSINKLNSMYSSRLGGTDIPQAPAPVPPQPAPAQTDPRTMTREMALQIILREKALKAQQHQQQQQQQAVREEAEKRVKAHADLSHLKSSYLVSLAGASAPGHSHLPGLGSPYPPSAGTVAAALNELNSNAGLNGLAAGGLGGIAGGLSGPMRSSSLLSDYLAQRNAAAATHLNTPIPAPLPTIMGNISSMTDNQIKAMLHTLKQAGQPMLHRPPAVASAANNISSTDAHSMINLIRNSSLMSTGGGDVRRASASDPLRTSDHLANAARLAGTDPLAANALLRHQSGASNFAGSEIDHYASKYATLMTGAGAGSLHAHLNPPLPATASELALAAAKRTESLGLQQAMQDAMRYLGPYDTPNLDASESLGPTPLRPGVSAALVQMKMSQLMGKEGVHGNGTSAMPGRDGDKHVFWVPPGTVSSSGAPASAGNVPTMNPGLEQYAAAAAGANSATQTFKTGMALNEHVKMTEAVQRATSGNSLGDLCRAAGLYLTEQQQATASAATGALKPGKTDSDLLDDSDHGGAQLSKATSAASTPAPADSEGGISRKIKGFQGLMDAKQQRSTHKSQERKSTVGTAAAAVTKKKKLSRKDSAKEKSSAKEWALAQEWENVKKVSSARAAALQIGKNDQSLVDDSDSDDDRPIAAMGSKRKARHSFDSTSTEQQGTAKRLNGKKRKHSLAEKRTHLTTFESSLSNTPNRGSGINRGVSFSHDIRSLPITETLLDRGHSLAMSEISLDRGQSFSNPTEAKVAPSAAVRFASAADEGQFDDASEDEEDQERDSSSLANTLMNRGMTIGTINTFSDLI